MKKIISAILAAAVILSFASCGNVSSEETTTAPKETETTATTTTESTTTAETTESETTTVASETEESTENVENPPAVEATEVADLERIAVGEYVTLVYNGASADVTVDVKRASAPVKTSHSPQR